jgi:hypothetical protein
MLCMNRISNSFHGEQSFGRSQFRGSIPGRGLRIILFSTASRPALVSTQPPFQWVLGALSLGVKWPKSRMCGLIPP